MACSPKRNEENHDGKIKDAKKLIYQRYDVSGGRRQQVEMTYPEKDSDFEVI